MSVTKSFVIKNFKRFEDTCCSTKFWCYTGKTASIQESIKCTALNDHKFSLKFLLNLPFHTSERSKKFTLPNTVYDSPIKRSLLPLAEDLGLIDVLFGDDVLLLRKKRTIQDLDAITEMHTHIFLS